jgi:sulfate/thiosulfate transport system ATP-binding protein
MAISLHDVHKSFGEFKAVDGVSLEVPEGSLTALLGPSGSGKSTLLRLIAGLEQPDHGDFSISGEPALGVPPQRRGIGFVFQHYAAFKHMSVRDNVAFGLSVRRRPKAEIRRRVDDLLSVVGLSGYADRYPSQLSGGQRQRMALARALAVEPRVLLRDEPFGALDANVRAELRSWLRGLHDDLRVTTLIVTHDQEEAMEVADQVVILRAGRIEQVGPPREIYQHPANDWVMGFLGPISRIGDHLVRPHDVSLALEPEGDALEAMVARVVHLGSQVRVELELAGGGEAHAQLTPSEADALELDRGDIVYLRHSPAGHSPVGHSAAAMLTA